MKTVLFIITQHRECFNSQLMGFYQRAKRQNWRIQVIERAACKDRMLEIFRLWNPIGAIVEYGGPSDLIGRDVCGRIPIVYFDIGRTSPPRGCCVSFDSAAAGLMGAEHLLGFGLPCYAYVGYWERVTWDAQRERAFGAAVRRAGKAYRRFPIEAESGAANRAARLQSWLRELPLPCGVMAANDRVAEEVLNACQKIGIAVPDELVVLGVDNDRVLCENLTPTLSTIVPDEMLEGNLSVELLIRQIEAGKRGVARKIVRVPPLNVQTRQSTRYLPCRRSDVSAALEMIRREASSGIGVNDVAAFMGVTRRMAERHFRLCTGRSILNEILEVRFGLVYDFLRHSDCRIDAIAGQSGFRTEVALRKAFRAREGCSMSVWRKRHFA